MTDHEITLPVHMELTREESMTTTMPETITATPVRDIDVGRSDVTRRLWRLSRPVPYGYSDEPNRPTTNHVVTSAANVLFSGPETYVFPSDETGDITDYGEMEGSFHNELDHEQAIRNAGWTIAPVTK